MALRSAGEAAGKNESAHPAESAMNAGGSKNRGPLFFFIVIAGLGAVAALAWFGGRGGSVTETSIPLETFVVNLAGAGPRAYLRIGITLGLARPLPARNPGEAVPTALVRDTILSVLSTAQPDALLGIDGKRRLKDDLLKALQERVPGLAIQNVYFTEFLVQM